MHIIERKVDRPIEVNQIEYSGLSVTLADSMYQPEMAVVRNTRRICRPDGNLLKVCPPVKVWKKHQWSGHPIHLFSI